MSSRYHNSEVMLDRALKSIPLGSQTFSKSITQLPLGAAPFFARHAKGSRLWDVDDNEYLDFVGGLCAINLGYGDPDVNSAVRTQLEDGVIFTLAHPLEHQVAELIIDMVPCAEMVRFGKNGSDATSGAIRVARAFTKRDRVAVCGYHGWQDWYIGSTSCNLGVPEATSALTYTFPYNDSAALDSLLSKHSGEFAAVIMEPMNITAPLPNYLAEVKDITHRHGAVLIFDETITGFRYGNGGAQALFGVTPDLATFGKGMANGFPVSAVAGRADIMSLMEKVFFSFTFGGETLSLAAAQATLLKLQRTNATDVMASHGQMIQDGLRKQITSHGLDNTLSVAGHPTWSFLVMKDTQPYTTFDIKTLYLQEMFKRGILTIGTHNMSYAHTKDDVSLLLRACDETFSVLKDATENKCLHDKLTCPVLKPLFKVR
ncbi:MAG: aminotransferase class III-fold pyridoxal phosphate-dependent enzyme [Rhodospirillaceae bacterium]|nr:aminotransferase class III-fold pyridoxal phosphate-dependent enzyme [Rhodospirillaceae bacterium]